LGEYDIVTLSNWLVYMYELLSTDNIIGKYRQRININAHMFMFVILWMVILLNGLSDISCDI